MLQNYSTPCLLSSIGIRQGDTLSPTLFSIFFNYLSTDPKTKHQGASVEENWCCVLLYADAIAHIADTTEEMQPMLNTVEAWYKNGDCVWIILNLE